MLIEVIVISALLISICVLTLTMQNIFTKQYNLKCPNGKYTYATLKVLFALVFFIVSTKNIYFSVEIVPYSVVFATAYTLSTITSILAIKFGSLAITALIISYSLIIPTAYGFIKEFVTEQKAPSVIKLIGIAFLLVSLFLIRQKSDESEKKVKKKLSTKWLINVIIAFVTNGLCSVFQSAQEEKFNGTQNGNFMISALLIGFVALLVLTIIFERKLIFEAVKKGFVLGAVSGLCNGTTNLLVMVIIATVATSVFFPVLSACQLILTFLISTFFYKEKFVVRQIIGLGCGITALILLNL